MQQKKQQSGYILWRLAYFMDIMLVLFTQLLLFVLSQLLSFLLWEVCDLCHFTSHSLRVVLDLACRHTSLYARGLGLFSGRRPFSSFLLSLTPPLSQVSLQKAYTAGASSPVDHINPSAHDSPPRCHCLVVSLTHTP